MKKVINKIKTKIKESNRDSKIQELRAQKNLIAKNFKRGYITEEEMIQKLDQLEKEIDGLE